ncbi:DUF6941 family protein [Bacteroides nordii]|uniref:DUF6941 family protein n=1 Tax=Bacteroides nordii TaxID=291645 RepID=UPI00399BC557
MNIEVLTLCEYTQTIGDKLNVLGAFNTFVTENMPIHHTFSIVVKFRYDRSEFGEKHIKFRIESPSGKKMIDNVMASVDIKKINDPFLSVSLSINVNNILFDEYGTFHVYVETDGNTFDIPLYVKKKE